MTYGMQTMKCVRNVERKAKDRKTLTPALSRREREEEPHAACAPRSYDEIMMFRTHRRRFRSVVVLAAITVSALAAVVGSGSAGIAGIAAINAFQEDVDSPAIEVPRGLPDEIPTPDDNPLSVNRIELGRRLFFDAILSEDGSTSCSTCHLPERAFAGDKPKAIGIHGREGRRNAPSILNRALGTSQFWDGRAATLEEQALQPIQSSTELGSSIDAVLERLKSREEYRRAFNNAFLDGITADNVARALASFERSLLTGDSPVDRFRTNDFIALSDEQRQGLWLFESRGQCWRCHSGPNFADERFHNTGVSWGAEPADLGRFEVTNDDSDRGKFKTPTLRNVALTGPYMHDGSIATLREVVQFYSRGGNDNPNLDPIIKPLELTERDVEHLVAFLEAVTGSTTYK